jgi:hypothetical protein
MKMTTPKKISNDLIQFDSINVNVIESNSGIFIGTNYQFCWNSHSKKNIAFGELSGHSNIIQQNMNLLCDNDLIDTPIDDRDLFLHQQYSSSV